MKPATILLVEDDEPMLVGIYELVQIADIGYDLTVLTAENGKVALDVLSKNTPDLIISDINMPHMDGIELLTHLRQHPQWLYIPVIFLTAKGSREDIHLAKTHGVERYITKPFDSSELIEFVKSQLDRTFQLAQSRQQVIAALKGDILQILNHELNTPLTYVMAYSELLLDTHQNLEDLSGSYDFLRGIQAGCLRLTRLVTDFIQIIEIRTGETAAIVQQNLEPIDDIVPILEKALHNSRNKLMPNVVPVNFARPERPFVLLGHVDSLIAAFERLIDNAIKFSFNHKGAAGKVEIAIAQTENELKISIYDEGIGFPHHVYQQIFELFYQYNRKEYEQQGTGTGLTIAQELIQLHNGRIEVESTQGKGSLFQVILPAYVAESANADMAMTSRRKQATVLIVEDDTHLLAGLEELLEIFDGKYQLNTLTAKNGIEGLEQLARNHPHLIISDIMMPKMGGLEFLEHVRKLDEFVQVPFIFLTAKGERRDILNGIILGAEEYITKPYDSDQLLDLVVAQLDKYFQRQSLLTKNFESLKRRIIQLMSPDFHNPLEVVAENTQEVLSQIKSAHNDDELKNSLQNIRQGSSQLNLLVKSFIALAELTTDEAKTAFDFQARSIPDMAYLVQQVVSLVTYDLQNRGVVIKRTIEPDLPAVFGVEGTISECIQNTVQLVATHYLSAQDKTIHLSVGQAEEDVYIAVAGDQQVSEEKLQSIQDLLAQERQAKVDLLGHDAVLKIVQGHIALHNGRIQLSNDPYFTITLILPIQPPTP